MEWDDYEWVNLRSVDMIYALNNALIDAFTAWEPLPSQALAAGKGKLLKRYATTTESPVVWIFTQCYLDILAAGLKLFKRQAG